MKTKQGFIYCNRFACATAAALMLSSSDHLLAVDGLSIEQSGADIVLSWPSVPGETYAVLYNPSLSSDSQWSVLVGSLPAASGTDTTTFVHEGVNPTGQMLVGGGGGGASAASLGEESKSHLPWWDRWKAEDRKPYVWEAEKRPPYPWEAAEWSKAMAPYFTQEPQALEAQAANAASTGFYQVKGVRVTSGLANGVTISGFGDIAIATEADAKYVRLLVDGKDFRGADTLISPLSNPLTFESVDSGRMQNGSHTIQVEAVWHVPNADSDGLVTALSAPFNLNVLNELSFPEWEDDTGDEVNSFHITSAHPVVTWEIDIYNYWDYLDWLDGVIPTIDPIHIKTGSTADGKIVYHWNLVDDFGQLRNDPDIDPIFISFTFTEWQDGGGLGGGAQAPGNASRGNPTQRQSARWPEEGLWVVAYQDMFRHYYDQNNLVPEMLSGWLGPASGHDPNGGASYPVFYQPPVGGPAPQTFPLRFNYWRWHRLYDDNDNLTQYIINDSGLLQQMILDSRARNFYYFGHGSPQWIGNFLYAPLLRQYAAQHRYRFVWLDGCETASGSWGAAFGIPGSGTFSLDYYRERTRRPALIVGHNYSIPLGIKGTRIVGGVTYDGTIPDHVPFFRSESLFNWYFIGDRFVQAIEQAKDTMRLLGLSDMRYVDGPKEGQRYEPGNDLLWTGYEDMRFNEFNARNEIPRP
jgi:hypothetical protein